MGIELLPIIGLTLVLILSNGGSDKHQPKPPQKKIKAYQTKDYIKVKHPEADYEAILRFIEKRYRKILPKEREEIARTLIDYGKNTTLIPFLQRH